MCLEAADNSNIFPLVTLNALYQNLGSSFTLRFAGFGCNGFGFFLGGVFGGAFLRVDREGGKSCTDSFCGEDRTLVRRPLRNRRENSREASPSEYNRPCISGRFFSSHSSHFLTVPPNSQYCMLSGDLECMYFMVDSCNMKRTTSRD